MYIINFEVQERKPKQLQFEVDKKKPVDIQFELQKKEPIRLIVEENFNLYVEK